MAAPTPQSNRGSAPAPTPAPHSPANAAEDAAAPKIPGGNMLSHAVDSVKEAVGLGEKHPMTADPAHAGTVGSLAEAIASLDGIEVRALMPGFIYNERKVEGDVFKVGSMEELGDWMECVDESTEKKHKKLQRDRKNGIVPAAKDEDGE